MEFSTNRGGAWKPSIQFAHEVRRQSPWASTFLLPTRSSRKKNAQRKDALSVDESQANPGCLFVPSLENTFTSKGKPWPVARGPFESSDHLVHEVAHHPHDIQVTELPAASQGSRVAHHDLLPSQAEKSSGISISISIGSSRYKREGERRQVNSDCRLRGFRG